MITGTEILNARILIVDDQAANIAVLKQMLQGAGYVSVTSTRNPCEVRDLYREHRHDLIVLDLLMPGMDGFEVMEGLKEIELGGYLPVLVITALPGHKLSALKAGARDFVSKPFDHAEVLVRVRNMLEVRLLHRETHRRLVETSRLAGMAEVATGVLHNVGNVLNSVNVTSSCLAESLRKSKTASLTKVAALLGEHQGDLAAFFSGDERGRQLPGYVAKLADHLAGEREGAIEELARLQRNIEHIKEIVSTQQNFSKRSGTTETLFVADLMEEALTIESCTHTGDGLAVTREFENVPLVTVERHKVLQILVNLVSNAKQACEESSPFQKRLTLRLSHRNERIHIVVDDNGIGIPPENLTRIFAHGFTTKPSGHGFGLHNSSMAAREMGGSLAAHSDGRGRGATFTLELPVKPASSRTREHDGLQSAS